MEGESLAVSGAKKAIQKLERRGATYEKQLTAKRLKLVKLDKFIQTYLDFKNKLKKT